MRSFIAAAIALIAFGSRGAFADPVPTSSTEQAAKAHCPADAVVGTLLYLNEFESERQYAMRAVQLWRSGSVQSHPEDFDTPVVGCLCYRAVRANINEAISQWRAPVRAAAKKSGKSGGLRIG